ncbi:hypothetical protein GETHLI_20970 [Geothrix limicola]|uniref:DUF3999 domain-containing protein n=1 Tax=Geothrix limicola TaxID=2927978 RepID=A0ABQ5QHE4_9BACT|nr:hypothetical protein [Geothrix limicola]GLH73595.1 hypothetical protein GETHLI_20970 [Geothrix limicola]
MKRAACLLLLLLACTREDRASLQRRPISPSPAPTSGWARLPLDAASQRLLKGAWIGDATGRSIPFLEAREGLWASRALPLENLLLGKDAEGRPTAEFTLKLPEGWQVGERETLRLDLDLDGHAPWVAQVKAERQREGGGFIAYDPVAPLHLYDLSPSGSRRGLDLPWDGQRYRLTLIASQGEAPRLRSLSVRAETRPEALEAELALEGAFAPEPGQPGTWRLRLPDTERIVGLELTLAPPAAPLRPEIRIGESPADALTWSCSDLVWNLPALGTRATRIALAPVQAGTLTISLPEGATPLSLRALVRRQTLLFPAEAGQAYALHLGGEAKPAPGSLGALPSLRSLASSAPLSLGAAEPDAQGLPHREGADQRARPWMPWIAGLALLVLGTAAWRLFKAGEGSAS